MAKDTLSCRDLTNYLNKVLNSYVYKSAIKSLNGAMNVDNFYSSFINIIAKYYISTFDDSLESAEEICKEYFSYVGKGNDFFYDVLMDKIVQKCSNELGIEVNGIKDYYEVCKLVEHRNNKNTFYTHCFPGALIDEVKENGLDVSKMRFKQEINILSKYFKTAYKIGGLYYCELSKGSISYSFYSAPESVSYFIGGIHPSDKEESVYELYLRSFLENLDKLKSKGVSIEELNNMYIAGKRIIDFYCSVNKSGIAFFKEEHADDFEYNFNVLDITNNFRLNSFMFNKIKEVIKKMNNNPEKAFDIWDEEINKICTGNDELRKTIDAFVRQGFSYYLQNIAIKNYNFAGNADGYEIEGGKLSKEQIEILEVDIPNNLHNKLQNSDIPNLKTINVPVKEDNFSDTINTCYCIERLASLNKNILEVFTLQINGTELVAYISDNGFEVLDGFYIVNGNNIYVSTMPVKRLEASIISRKYDSFDKKSPDIRQIIENYKRTDIYDEYFDKGDDLIEAAIFWYIKSRYELLPNDDKQKALYEESLKFDSVNLSYDNGNYYINRNSIKEPVIKKCLVSNSINAPYNALFLSMKEDKNKSLIK